MRSLICISIALLIIHFQEYLSNGKHCIYDISLYRSYEMIVRESGEACCRCFYFLLVYRLLLKVEIFNDITNAI